MLTRLKTLDILPVSLAEVKAHARLDHNHEDDYLITLIQAATGFVEAYSGRSLLNQVWRCQWEQEKPYPAQLSVSAEDICSVSLPYPPLRRILSVSRLAEDGKKIPIRRHRLEVKRQIPHLVFASVHEPVEIEYETGYGEQPADIPPLMRQAILMTVASFYECRDSTAMPKNGLIGEILDTYRVIRLP